MMHVLSYDAEIINNCCFMCHLYYVLDWVVCNISVVPEPGSSTAQQLYITRMQKNRLPVVMLARDMKYPRVWEKNQLLSTVSVSTLHFTF